LLQVVVVEVALVAVVLVDCVQLLLQLVEAELETAYL
jgi:hypothetical protein